MTKQLAALLFILVKICKKVIVQRKKVLLYVLRPHRWRLSTLRNHAWWQIDKIGAENGLVLVRSFKWLFPYTTYHRLLAMFYFGDGRFDESANSYLKCFVAGKPRSFDSFEAWQVAHVASLGAFGYLRDKNGLAAAAIHHYSQSNAFLYSIFRSVSFLRLRNPNANLVADYSKWIGDVKKSPLFKTFETLTIEGFEKKHPDLFRTLIPEGEFSFLEPKVFGATEPPKFRTVSVPAFTISTVKKAEIFGAFSVLVDENLYIYEPASHPRYGLVAGAWQYVMSLNPTGTKTLVHCAFNDRKPFSKGILISGRCTRNYYHWLIEYLPKLLAVSMVGNLRTTHLIVDADMPAQFFQSLDCLMKSLKLTNPIFKRSESTILKVDKLLIPSTPTFHTDCFDIPFWEGSALSIPHLQFLRENILRELGLQDATDTKPGRKKVFIARSSAGARSIINADQVQEFFVKQGFEVIYPEKMSFKEQVQLFNKADWIAGGGGAAFANLIFCKPGARVICLVSERIQDYCMQANLAKFAGADFIHITGPNIRPPGYVSPAVLAHSPFEIPISKLVSFFEQENK